MYKFSFNSRGVDESSLLTVAELFSLVEGTEFENHLKQQYNLEDNGAEPIPILGLRPVVVKMLHEERMVQREDVIAQLKDVSIYRDRDMENVAEIISTNGEEYTAIPEHSSARDFLNENYGMFKNDKLLATLGLSTLGENLRARMNEQNDFGEQLKSYRLIHKDDKTHLRGITSVGSYNDYGVPFSIVATIMTVFEFARANDVHFEVIRADIRDHSISMAVRQTSTVELEDIGILSFGLTLDNDEIRRSSLRLSANVSLTPYDRERAIVLRPPNDKADVTIRITHNVGPDKALQELRGLADFVAESKEWLVEDLKRLQRVTDPNKLRHWLLRRIKHLQKKELKGFKTDFSQVLESEISTIAQLFHLMDKMDGLVEDVSAKDELSFLFYQMVKEAKG